MSDILPALITTIGTLAGSFGGYTLAARSQRRQSDKDDERALRDAGSARLIAFEDERHEFQLKTLLVLQELTRLKARSTFLAIQHDRSTIERGQGYGQLPDDDPKEFSNAIEFGHNVARVTAPDLREQLESFQTVCNSYQLPPRNWNELDLDKALAIQQRRFSSLVDETDRTTRLLGEHLRNEINRHRSA